MSFQRLIDALVARAPDAPEGAPVGLTQAVPALATVRAWEGEWDTLDSQARLSFASPAALVSLLDLEVMHLGRTPTPLALSPHGVTRSIPPVTLTADQAAARPICSVQIAVTLITAAPGAGKRAESVLELAALVLPVLVDHGLTKLRGTNLAADGLRKKGLTAFVLIGERQVEIVPDVAAADGVPNQVKVIYGRTPLQIYPDPAC